MRTKSFVVVGVLVALFLAGFVSYYASSNPDGLEHVAEQTGVIDTAEEHAAAEGPLADYTTEGVENERLSGGLAGVIGAVVVLVLAGGLAFVVRRRGDSSEQPTQQKQSAGAGKP